MGAPQQWIGHCVCHWLAGRSGLTASWAFEGSIFAVLEGVDCKVLLLRGPVLTTLQHTHTHTKQVVPTVDVWTNGINYALTQVVRSCQAVACLAA